MHQIVAPGPTGGAYSALPDPLARGRGGEKEGGEGVLECPNSELASLATIG